MPTEQLIAIAAAVVVIVLGVIVVRRRTSPMQGTLTVYLHSRTIHEILLSGTRQSLDRAHAGFDGYVVGMSPSSDKRSRVKLTVKEPAATTLVFVDGQDHEIGDLVVEYQGQRNRALERITAEQAAKPRRGVIDDE